ncbi:MAG TPA: efflux transporter outer membrane subunit [Gemmatimonadales bacterium]|nr:efflux transporter outer membrane subunit [Gemmatimonadales bacterium]
MRAPSAWNRLWLVGLTLVIVACPVGPNFQTPPTAVPEHWRDSTISTQDSSFANLPWWQVVADTTLQELIRVALRENRDLRIALARVNESRAQLGIRRLELLPQINVGATLGQVNVNDSLLGLRTGTYGFYELSGTISWEIDLFGRLRRLNESAKAGLLATEYGRRGAIVTVVAEVARVYLELRDLDQQTTLQMATVETRRRSLDLARSRFEGGLTSELDVRQGEAELARAEGRLANIRLQANDAEQELNFLLGRMPGRVPRGAALINQNFRTSVPPGLPSALLQRRPDVRESEQQLRAANAMIGAAIAARFPTISLTGAGGTRTDAIGNLFQAGTGFWHLATNILLPIINAGRSGKQVAIERARTEAAVARYDQVVLNAFREVENGLVAVEQLQIQVGAAGRQVAAARRAVAIAQDRYQGGVDNYTTLLDAQRVLSDAELGESSLQRQQRVAVVQLYRALGGGWDPVTDSLALPPPAQ